MRLKSYNLNSFLWRFTTECLVLPRVGIDKNCYIKQDILEIYKSEPTYGVRRLKYNLRKNYGWKGIGDKKVARCMKELGIKAIYTRKRINTSTPNKRHRKFLIQWIQIFILNHWKKLKI